MMELLRKALSLRRYTLRVQLTLLYSGLGIALCAAVLGAAGLVVRRGSSANSGVPGVIASSQDGTVRHFEVGAALIFGVAAVVALALGWWIAGRLLRPLRTITATARDISATNLHQRLGLDGPDDELTELGKTLDDLFGRLEASFEAQRHFVANASHELRTPLAGQRTLLQVTLADPGAKVESFRAACEEAVQLGDQQERLIDALLTLATSERGVEQWREFDLGQIAERVLAARRQEAQRRGIHIDASLVAAPASGDPVLVERLVANLIDNAMFHNMTGGTVEVSTTSAPERLTISVSNTGPMVPPAEVERLFQPFQRVGSERVRHGDGHGLGLAIVQAITQAHGAKLSARPRPKGGLEIQVTFTSSNA